MLSNHVNTKFVLLHDDSICPKRYYSGDAGYDLYAHQEITLPPLTVGYVKTGISVDLGEGVVAEVRGRSSNTKLGFFVLTGTVDNQYKGEIEVMVFNFKHHNCCNGYDCITIEKGQRIAQLVLQPLLIAKDEPKTQSLEDRGVRGFGSTGK